MYSWNTLLPLLLFFWSLNPLYTLAQKSTGSSDHYALLFAGDDYQNQKLDQLKNPIKDAQQIAAELEGKYGFEVKVVKNPKRKEINDLLDTYKEEFANGPRNPEGQLLIFFSGHGEYDEDSENGFFLPVDADPEDLLATSIPYSYIRPLINNINCKHILVVIDACFSGTFDEKIVKRSSSNFGKRPGQKDGLEKILSDHANRRTRLYLSSGAKDKTPDKSDFSKKILTALRKGGVDPGFISIDELHGLYTKKVSNPKPLMGEFGDDEAGSDFLFIEKKPQILAVDTLEEQAFNRADSIRDQLAQGINPLPAGSSRLKRANKFFLSIEGYLGTFIGQENPKVGDNFTTFGLNLPLGFNIAFNEYAGDAASWSLFFPILDLGMLTSVSVGVSERKFPDFTLENTFAPGVFLYRNFANTPISAGMGYQYGPISRELELNGVVTKSSSSRILFNLAIDIPFISLYLVR